MESKESIVKQWLTRFDQARKDPKQLFTFLQEIMEKFDTNAETTNKELISAFLPKLDELIQSLLSPHFLASADKMRYLTLKVFQKLCSYSMLPEQLQRVHSVLLDVARVDSEDNALIALQIIRDTLQKNSQMLDSIMLRIEKFVWEQFEEFSGRFQRAFISSDSNHNALPIQGLSTGQREPDRRVREKINSKDSFKVVSEIYTITLMAMGVNSKRLKPRMFDLIPVIVEGLSLMPSKKAQEFHKERFIEFLHAQNKMYLIIGSLLRISGNNEVLQRYTQRLVDYSITYMKNCPIENGQIRKQFLPLLKNMVMSYMDCYLIHFDDLINYEVLAGEGNGLELKTEASTIILNVAQYTKDRLNEQQKEKIIRVIFQMVNDIEIDINTQGTAILILNKYVDIINKMPQNVKLLMEMVEILTMKFEFLAKRLPTLFIKKLRNQTQVKHDDIYKIIGKAPNEPITINNELLYLKTANKDSDSDVGNLLKETKHIVQKMIALMQSVVNTLGCPGIQENVNLSQLSKLFRSGIKCFITKMTIYKIYSKNLLNEIEDIDKNIRSFLETFMRMDLPSFAQIMDKEISFLCKCITSPTTIEDLNELNIKDRKVFDNEFLLKIPQYMRDELTKQQTPNKDKGEVIQTHVGVFAYNLSKHLLEEFNNLGGYKTIGQSKFDGIKHTHYFSLFKYAMEMFTRIESNDSINSFYFCFIVLSMKYSKKARSFYNYFFALRTISKAIRERPEISREPAAREAAFRDFTTLLPGLIPILLSARKECAILNELFSEIFQSLPITFQVLIEYLPRLVRPLVECISSTRWGGGLLAGSIRSFDTWFGRLVESPELLDSLYELIPELVPSLHKLFNNQNLLSSIHRILSRLGGKSRLYINDKEANTKFYPDEGLRMLMKERQTSKELIMGLDSGLDASFRYLESTSRMRPESIKLIYKLVKAAYYAFMDNSFDSTYINQCYFAILNANYTEIAKIIERNSVISFDSSTPQTRVTPPKRDCQIHALEKLLTEIFYMTAVYYTRDIYTVKVLHFFNFVCDHLVLIGLCRNGCLTLGRLNEIGLITHLNVITEFLNESKDPTSPNPKSSHITYVAINAVKRIAESYVKIFNTEKDAILNVQLLELLLRKICSLFHWKEWMKKEGASLALLELMEILPEIFFIKYESEIICSLYYALCTLPKSITVTAHQIGPRCIQRLISICHSEPHFILTMENTISAGNGLIDYVRRVANRTKISPKVIEQKYIKNFKKIIELLVSGLHFETTFVRKVAKDCIEQMCNGEKLTLEQFFNFTNFTYIHTDSRKEQSSGGFSEARRLQDVFLQRIWSYNFSMYDYGSIISGLEFLLYFLNNNVMSNFPNIGIRLLELNEELLKIMKREIVECDELRKSASDQSIKTYYMILEKKHMYFHPVYEYSTNTIYNQVLKTEKERLEMPPNQPRKEPAEPLVNYMETILSIKDSPCRPSMNKGYQYIYKVFPNAELRLKAVCISMKFLCTEFLKFITEKSWMNFLLNDEMRKTFKEQLQKYLVATFRLLQREEKCLYKMSKNCLNLLYRQQTDGNEIFLDKMLESCIQDVFKGKLNVIWEYRKIMRVAKIFPNRFYEGFWNKLSESCKMILGKLKEENSHQEKTRFSSELNVACFLINCYKYKAATINDSETFRFLIGQVVELQRLITLCGTYDSILNKPLANLLNKYSTVVLMYLKTRHDIEHVNKERNMDSTNECSTYDLLKLISSVVKSHKTIKLRQALAEYSNSILSEILIDNYNKPENYHIIHELLLIISRLSKLLPDWIKTQQQLVYNVSKAWLSFIPITDKIQQFTFNLKSDFLRVAKFLINYLTLSPTDVDAAYILIEFLAYSESLSVYAIKQFFSRDFHRLIPLGAYRVYTERFLILLKDSNAKSSVCLNVINFLMTPLLFHMYQQQIIGDSLDQVLEEALQNCLFSSNSHSIAVQRKLIRLGALMLEYTPKERLDLSKRTLIIDIWKKVKVEDPGIRAWAFLGLSSFAGKVQMPNERVQEILHSFFIESHTEYKYVIQAATDKIVPILFKGRGNPQHDQNLLSLEKAIRFSSGSLQSLANIFGMISRNALVFKDSRHSLYPRMIQAFQKIFFYSRQYQFKVIAVNMASTMILWGMEGVIDRSINESERHIRIILATCLFKELYQYHYILTTEDSSDIEVIELTYKCLIMLKTLLMKFPDLKFSISFADNLIVNNHNRESIMYMSMLNVIIILLKYRLNDCTEELLKKLLESVQMAFQCKWPGKESLSSQKHPSIIQAICQLCILIKEKTNTYPLEWLNILTHALTQDLSIFYTEAKNHEKNNQPSNQHSSQQSKEENRIAGQERNQTKLSQEQVFHLIPHLTIRLCSVHSRLGIPLFQERLDQFFSSWIYSCKAFVKYLKQSEQINPLTREYFTRELFNSQLNAQPKFYTNWDWIDSDIIQFNTPITNMNAYIRESMIISLHYFAERTIENTKYSHKYFETLINVLGRDCIDEDILIEMIRAVRKVLMSNVKIDIILDSTQMGSRLNKGKRAKLLARLQERVSPTYERAVNEILELTYDYLKNAVNMKDHHRKLLNYTLLQLKSKGMDIRNKFFGLFDKYYGRSVYKRMQHIFLQQIWDYSKDPKDCFWIQQALDLLLSTIDENTPMKRESGGIVLLSFQDTNLNQDIITILNTNINTVPGIKTIDKNEDEEMKDVKEVKGEKDKENELMGEKMRDVESVSGIPEELVRISNVVGMVAEKLGHKRTRYWLRPLKDIANCESYICEKLWLKIFPQFWSTMTGDEQQQIASLIEPFLSREEFMRQMQNKKSNPIKTIFEAVSVCSPLPRLAPEIIQFIAKNYGAWHTALPLLESYLYAYPNNERYSLCMGVLLKHLVENDYLIGLQRYVAKSSTTRAALVYAQFQMWNVVDDLLSREITRYVRSGSTSGTRAIKQEEVKKVIEESKRIDEEAKRTPSEEPKLATEELKRIGVRESMEDNIASEVRDISQELSQLDLRIWEEWMTEAALNLGNWELIKSLGVYSSRVPLTLQYFWSTRDWPNFVSAAKRSGNSEVSTTFLATLYERFLQTSDDDTEREELYKKGLKTLHTDWNLLPTIVDIPHYKSLILQQHFFEINEFKNAFKDLRESLQKPEVNLVLPLNCWRNRLPDKSESFVIWRDLLECRNFLFSQLKMKLQEVANFDKLEPYVQDIPWNFLKLAQVARKHGLVDQAIRYLAEADKHLHDTGSVNNYEKFLRAKETAKLALDYTKEWEETADYLKRVETQTFCNKVNVFLSEIKRLRGELLLKLRRNQDAYTELSSAITICSNNYKAWKSFGLFCEMGFNEKHQPRYNAYTIKAYIHAAIYMLDKSKFFIPKIFQCLENDHLTTNGEAVKVGDAMKEDEVEDSASKVFMEISDKIPVWVWIYWIPELFTNLGRSSSERETARQVLKNIAILYPQSIFLILKNTQDRINSTTNENVLLAIKDIFVKLQERYSFRQIEKILNELEKKILITSSKETEFLLYLKHLYSLCSPMITIEAFNSCLNLIIQNFFLTKDETYNELKEKYYGKFFIDFSNEAVEGRAMTESLRLLRNWIDFLHTKTNLTVTHSSIDRYSSDLASLRPKNVEMFGANYIEDKEPTPENIIHIARIEIKLEKTYQRTRVNFRGTNEKDYFYYLQIKNLGNDMNRIINCISINDNVEILINQLRHFMNKIYFADRYTIQRNIKLTTPYVLCWGCMKMSFDESKIISMENLHEAALIERGYHPDHASITYFQRLAEVLKNSKVINISEKDIRKSIVKEMRETICDYILAGLMHRLVANPDELFVYKKQFTSQLAGQSFFSYIFGLSFKNLDSFIFCKRTGKVTYPNYGCSYNKENTVPFRLTPNLQYFITPIGIEGPFAGSMTAMACALVKKLKYLKAYLRIFYKNIWEESCWGKSAEDNCEKTIGNLQGLIDFEAVKKVFNARHAVFRTDTMETEKDLGFNHGIYKILKEAQDDERLNEMPLEWAPWF